MKKKIYHIHTDYKFLHDSDRFDDERFENVLIIIGNEAPQKELSFKTIFIQENEENLTEKVACIIHNADLIVIYNLCERKREIVKQIPKEVKIAWRFFGHELYRIRMDLVLSKRTLNVKEMSILDKLTLQKKFFKSRIYYFLYERKIVNRINYILLFFNEEYDFLRKYWEIPEFVKLNLNNKIEEKEFEFIEKKENIIVGNSRNIYNNHLDIIEIIEKNNTRNYLFTLFFNYGDNGEYAKKLRYYKGNPKFYFVEDFLSNEDFEKIYAEATALVINSYRQMALANILTAIKFGLKIYLNDKNPTKEWLIRNKIKIHSFEDFEKDLMNNNLSLNLNEKYENVRNFNKIVANYSRKEFCDNILKMYYH